jgi:flagella basal body P-ring formation protein FlgA
LAPVSPAFEALQQQDQMWAAAHPSFQGKSVQVASVDPRITVQSCQQNLQFEHPFPNQPAVRVRCARPAWQQFVRVSVAGKAPEIQVQAKADTPPEPAKRWVLVASVPLQRGMMLNETHVQRAQVDASVMPVNVLEQTSEVLHAEVVRDVRPGVPLRSHDIRPTVLVKRGQMVLLSVGQPQGFQISARVEAMQDGRFGEQIKLKNRDSGRELSGRVQGPNQVMGL